jgi:hypothetical protein
MNLSLRSGPALTHPNHLIALLVPASLRYDTSTLTCYSGRLLIPPAEATPSTEAGASVSAPVPQDGHLGLRRRDRVIREERAVRFVGLQSELAVKKLYTNSVDFRSAITLYGECGFQLSAFVPNNAGYFPQLIETDCIMVRDDLIFAAH